MKFSKRAKLVTVNIVIAILLLILMFINAYYETTTIWSMLLVFAIIQGVFTILSLIVYHLSIISDALKEKDKTEQTNIPRIARRENDRNGG